MVGHYKVPDDSDAGNAGEVIRSTESDDGMFGVTAGREGTPITAPATPEALQWEGWGTALKPAHEPIVVARRPPSGTVAQTVLEHGTGALNIDGCRVSTKDDLNGGAYAEGRRPRAMAPGGAPRTAQPEEFEQPTGRWPANVVLSEVSAAELDEQTGVLVSGPESDKGHRRNADAEANRNAYGGFQGQKATGVLYGDSGGASRFFYCAKTSRAERNAGLEGFAAKALNWSSGEESPGTFQGDGTDRSSANHHPTVKPINLMRWLVRLVTPPGGLILDPFLGSGSTGCAAVLEGFDFTGIEREPEYITIAEARIAFWAQHEGREVEEVLKLNARSTKVTAGHKERGQGDLLALAAETSGGGSTQMTVDDVIADIEGEAAA